MADIDPRAMRFSEVRKMTDADESVRVGWSREYQKKPSFLGL
jgi:hypothetical protein